jgi:hypothetical protein
MVVVYTGGAIGEGLSANGQDQSVNSAEFGRGLR